EQGRPVPVEELCRDCPDLLDELRRQVRALEAMGRLVQGPPAQAENTLGPTADSGGPLTLDARAGPRGAEPAPLPEIAGYEVLRELGRGGMGVVYLALQTSLGRLVALKMILADAYSSPQQRHRFRAEAELVARLQHPNIVGVHEVGEVGGRPFCALEFV